MHIVKENDVYKRERIVEFTLEEIITFKNPKPTIYEKRDYDWYMAIALEKSEEHFKIAA